MVVKPTDIVNWEGDGVRLETEIDDLLRKKWKGSGFVRFDLPFNLPSRITHELIGRYQEAGWVVSCNRGSCQKEGDWHFLEFREFLPG